MLFFLCIWFVLNGGTSGLSSTSNGSLLFQVVVKRTAAAMMTMQHLLGLNRRVF